MFSRAATVLAHLAAVPSVMYWPPFADVHCISVLVLWDTLRAGNLVYSYMARRVSVRASLHRPKELAPSPPDTNKYVTPPAFLQPMPSAPACSLCVALHSLSRPLSVATFFPHEPGSNAR